jgi:hypothetical protein
MTPDSTAMAPSVKSDAVTNRALCVLRRALNRLCIVHLERLIDAPT